MLPMQACCRDAAILLTAGTKKVTKITDNFLSLLYGF
jgi:hypothetical protein